MERRHFSLGTFVGMLAAFAGMTTPRSGAELPSAPFSNAMRRGKGGTTRPAAVRIRERRAARKAAHHQRKMLRAKAR